MVRNGFSKILAENLKNMLEEGGKMGFGTKRKTTQTQTRRRIDKEVRTAIQRDFFTHRILTIMINFINRLFPETKK